MSYDGGLTMSATISDVAKKSGVSLATVSRVLNNSGYVKSGTRERVLKAINEINYTPNAIARSLSKNETNTIGVIVPDIANSYFGEILKGISEVSEANDLNIILFNTDDNLEKELRALDMVKAQKIQGVIMTPNFGGDELNTTYINKLENLGVPLVLVAADVKYTNINGVFVDNIKGAFDATNALINEGHIKIGIVKGQKTSQPIKEMFMGYEKSLRFNNIDVREDFIYIADFRSDLAYEVTKEMLKSEDRPTALMVCSNMMTLGCVKAILEANLRIPEDMAIIGFNKNELFDLVGVGISYVDDAAEELGRTSMKMLNQIINEKDSVGVKRITIKPTVVLKGSEKGKSNERKDEVK